MGRTLHQPLGDLYDCKPKAQDSQWSDAKRVWCCKHQGYGCNLTVSKPFGCQSGYSNCGKGWSVATKLRQLSGHLVTQNSTWVFCGILACLLGFAAAVVLIVRIAWAKASYLP